jgi:hypothetical protein
MMTPKTNTTDTTMEAIRIVVELDDDDELDDVGDIDVVGVGVVGVGVVGVGVVGIGVVGVGVVDAGVVVVGDGNKHVPITDGTEPD